MSKHGWLTSETMPTDNYICRVLRIPNDLFVIANVNGAIQSLCEPYNYEQWGAVTIEETVTAMEAMYDVYRQGTVCMIGALLLYATNTAPSNVLLCDGSTHLRVDYPMLYAKLSPIYITDVDHFVTPNPPSFVGLNYYIVYR